MYRIGGRQRTLDASLKGVTGGIPLLRFLVSNLHKWIMRDSVWWAV